MRKYQLFLFCSPIFLLAACGGGGSGESSNNNTQLAPTPEPKIPTCTTNQYLENNVCQDKTTQSITGLSLPNSINVEQSINLIAKSSAGLKVSYSSKTPDNCTVIDNLDQQKVEMIGIGICTIEANQVGNNKILAATTMTVSTTVLPTLTATGIYLCGTETNNQLSCDFSHLGEIFGLGQDGEIQAGRKMEYSPVKYNNDDCIQDNVTGLIWEQKTDDGGLRNKEWRYTDSSVGGNTCGKNLNKCTTTEYIKALNNKKYCGYSDWRMPTRSELINIVDYAHTQPAINPIFTNTNYIDWYWTATPGWRVDFNYGSSDGATSNDYTGHIRAVRGGQ